MVANELDPMRKTSGASGPRSLRIFGEGVIV
jgi:hypothetical protein